MAGRGSNEKSGAGKSCPDGKSRPGRNRMTLITVSLFFLAVLTAGCGNAEEPVPVELTSGSMEELRDESAGDDGSEQDTGGDDSETDSDRGIGGETDESGSPAVHGKGDDTENDAAREAKQADADNDSQAAPEDVKNGSDAPAAPDGAQTGSSALEGNVYSVSGDSFVIVRQETWTEGDASYAAAAAPGYEEDEDLVTVHVAERCEYQYKTVKNGGINPEDVSTREGSFTDLRDGIAVGMKGSWQEDGSFLADRIEMMEIV